MAVVTSPTGVGAVAFSGAAVACAGVFASAVACYSHNENVLFSMSGDKGAGETGFDKQKNGTPGNNRAQNKQFRDVVKKLKLNKEQQRELHDEISGENYGYQEILETAKDMFGK